MDIIAQCISLLQDNGYFEKEYTLRQCYDKYLAPKNLPMEDDKLWDTICSTELLSLFQFNTSVGSQVVKRLQPRNLEELTSCNALMRLTGEDGSERPADRYYRLKNDVSKWYDEMNSIGLTPKEQSIMEKYCLKDYGTPSSQETLMLILMDKDTCNFSLSEANTARKICAKKKMDKIPWLHKEVVSRAPREVFGEYIWKIAIEPSMSYSFSMIHGTTYSYIACQGAYLATYYPSIFWNTAHLRVVSGLDGDSSSNYDKIAKGVGDIRSRGINVSLVDINNSGYMFEPDESNNTILYGLKAVSGLNGDTIEEIVSNRPYSSLEDFIDKVKCNKTVMFSLIKSGAFDCFEKREKVMEEYISICSEPKKRITMQNFNMLVEKNLIPKELEFEKRLFVFNKALKKNCKYKNGYLKVENNYYDFFEQFFDIDELEFVDNILCIKEKNWKQLYDSGMLDAKTYVKSNNDILLYKLNSVLFNETWEKYASGNLSKWEMDSVGFYYHDHELKSIDDSYYGIVEYNTLPEEPIVYKTFKRNNVEIPIYELTRICGTVIAKDDARSSVSILTKESGVVTVKFNRDYYAKYKQQLSIVNPDGSKTVVEKGWFNRGTLIVVNGFRRQNAFVAKAYKKTESHQLYKITKIYENSGLIEMTNDRTLV